MKTKKQQRPIYVKWEKVMLAQIAANVNSIKCLTDEVKATRVLLKAQKRTLAKARKDEAAI